MLQDNQVIYHLFDDPPPMWDEVNVEDEDLADFEDTDNAIGGENEIITDSDLKEKVLLPV